MSTPSTPTKAAKKTLGTAGSLLLALLPLLAVLVWVTHDAPPPSEQFLHAGDIQPGATDPGVYRPARGDEAPTLPPVEQ